MLKILENLFDSLNESQINYCLYKSLSDFDEDSNGLRGDIDILVDKNHFQTFDRIAKESGFISATNPYLRKYYIGNDIHSNLSIILDVSLQIPAGVKPFKNHFLSTEISSLKTRVGPKNIKMLDWCDYIPLMFILRLNAKAIKQHDIDELRSLLDTHNIKPSYMTAQLQNVSGISWSEMQDNIKSNSVHDNQTILRNKTKKLLSTDRGLIIRSYLIYLYKIRYFLLSRMGRPQFLIKGRAPIIAIMGVDGAGKSSAIEYLQNSDFLKMTGVRFIYMGNNNYWMPGMNMLIKLSKRGGIFKKIAIIFAFLDKRMRTLFMLYHSYMGNIVIADRYFYDEFVSREVDRRQRGPINKKLHKIYDLIFNNLLFLHPDMTVYLDVSPEVAFSRKQDYEFAKVKKMIEAYRNFFHKHSNVILVNADKPHETVKRNVMEIILQERYDQ